MFRKMIFTPNLKLIKKFSGAPRLDKVISYYGSNQRVLGTILLMILMLKKVYPIPVRGRSISIKKLRFSRSKVG